MATSPRLVPRKIRNSACIGIEHIELYTNNIVQSEYFYCGAFGFTPAFRSALSETAVSSRIVRAGATQLLLTSPMGPGPVADHLTKHGEGVKDVALRVTDATATFEAACAAGATAIQPPKAFQAQEGGGRTAIVETCGALQHTLVECHSDCQTTLTGLVTVPPRLNVSGRGIERVDHVAIGVEAGTLDWHCEFYERAFGLAVCHSEQVVTNLSAMNSKVVQNESGTVTFSIVEPLKGVRRSQVDEFLTYNHGPGAQHVAFLTDDIVRTVAGLRAEGIEFLPTPAPYYEGVLRRVGKIDENLSVLRDLGILADRDEYGYLLQIFTKPVQTTPTFFVEIIQRRGAKGFGSGNIRALFEALEKEQGARGNL